MGRDSPPLALSIMQSNGLIADLSQWWEKPFDTTNGSVANWLYITGFFIILVFVWSIILKGLLAVVETAAA